MPLTPPTTDGLLQLGGSAAVGAAVTKAWEWISKQGRNKSYTMGAVDHAVSTAMGLVTERLERVEGQHQVCENELNDVRERLDKSERDRADLRHEIKRLMSGPVAPYGDVPPTD